ncbi:translocation and assembly module lipoprotein TamL [Flavobacterium psychrotrophum]|uniref:translocation and assembly module lipoprotein TamL n=1 Tax=Flavobacterium psychrotrophum TaxID=2294119 RepID=UPI000E315D9C|nr:BamA/TamA family outer membrane protein [Flavobacterium psychrotrophum]
MRNITTKIILFTILTVVLVSCELTKRVPEDRKLLERNEIRVNGQLKEDEQHFNQLYQQENSNILGFHLRLHMYSFAKPNADSSYHAMLNRRPGLHKTMTGVLSEKQVDRLGKSFLVSGISNFLKRTGEPPVLIDLNRIKKSKNRLYAYYYKQGYFRAKASFTIDTLANKRAVVKYDIETGEPYRIDSINTYIETPVLDEMYNASKNLSVLRSGKQYMESDFAAERERIYQYFKNRGVYKFEQNYINYKVDTINTGRKANVDIIIDNEQVRQGDSTFTRPFKIYKISQVNIFTKNRASKDQAKDTANYNGFNIISTGKLNYRPKALTDAVFITPGSVYADFKRTRTSRALTNLKVFYYPSIQYIEDPADSTGTSLIANIDLNPRKKFRFNMAADFNHSNIQDFGIQGSLGVTIRNIFRGAETLDLSVRGNIGSSRDVAIKDRAFFNILEYGADAKLNIPRIWLPFNTESIIPKDMLPNTLVSLGVGRQKNIGLDKENLTGILSYNWIPQRNRTAKLDLLNLQYIRNVNPGNYFKVYQSSYSRLNQIANEYPDIAQGYFDENHNLDIDSGMVDAFIQDVRSNNAGTALSQPDTEEVNRLGERKRRLTENNLISATNFTYTTTTRDNLTDNNFFIFKTKLESAGGILGLIAPLMDENKGVPVGSRTMFDVQYSQYIKGEVDFIKHFDLRHKRVLAMRAFFGLAVPYGNSNSIPFTRSYFGGGSNDNRAWQSYSLGPGRSGSKNDFNEANLKLAYSAELRFNIFGQFYGALFGDLGNIWNVFDAETDKDYTFNGFSSLRDLALGTGTGFRYDFNFFVVRFDVGFKTYDPGREEGTRWFKGYNFGKSVLNVGINYPF